MTSTLSTSEPRSFSTCSARSTISQLQLENRNFQHTRSARNTLDNRATFQNSKYTFGSSGSSISTFQRTHSHTHTLTHTHTRVHKPNFGSCSSKPQAPVQHHTSNILSATAQTSHMLSRCTQETSGAEAKRRQTVWDTLSFSLSLCYHSCSANKSGLFACPMSCFQLTRRSFSLLSPSCLQ